MVEINQGTSYEYHCVECSNPTLDTTCYEIATFGCCRWRSVTGREEPQTVANERKATILVLVESDDIGV